MSYYCSVGKSGGRPYIAVILAALVISSLALFVLGPGGCKKKAVSGKDVLATVNGEPITVDEYKADVEEVPAKFEDRQAELWKLINRKLISKEAIAKGMLGDPGVYYRLEKFYIDSLPGLLRKDVAKEVTVTDSDLDEVKKKMNIKPIFDVLLIVTPSLDAAEKALSELKNGARFEDVATKYSSVKAADREISLDDTMYPVGVRAALNGMKPGTISPAMKIDIGYAIFKLKERKEPENLWKTQEAKARQEIKDQKVKLKMDEILNRLRSSADIKINKRVLPGGDVEYLGAEVNGVKIMMDPQLFGASQDPHAPHRSLNPQTLYTALNNRINDVLYTQEARVRGLQYVPEYQDELNRNKEEILANVYSEKVMGTPDATQDEIKAYYEKNKEKYSRRLTVRVSRIVLPTKEQAEEVARQLKSGKDFASIAKERSLDKASAAKGGEVGYVTPEDLKEPLKTILAGMKPGEISSVVKGPNGFEILKVTDRKVGGEPELNTIMDDLRKRVILTKRSERIEAFYKSLHDKAKIDINRELLESL